METTIRSPLLDLFRSRVQADLMALLYLNPDSTYSITEAAAATGHSTKAVHREAGRLVSTGFAISTRRGGMRLLQAVSFNPVTMPLTSLLAATYGPLPVLTELLTGTEGVQEAYIYGSWAARYSGELGPIPNDVDVLAIGDADRFALYDIAITAAERMSPVFTRDVSIRVLSPECWNTPPEDRDAFLQHVRSRPLIKLSLAPTAGKEAA